MRIDAAKGLRKVVIATIGLYSLLTEPGMQASAQAPRSVWKPVGMGGGGAMFFPAISPHDPKTIFLACDMGGAYVTHDGGDSWRMFNLINQVKGYVYDPKNPNIVYATATGLFKSGNKGQSWELIYPRPRDLSAIVSKGDHANEILVTKDSVAVQVLATAIDPANPKIIYLGVRENTIQMLLVTTDGGLHWKMERSLVDGVKSIFIDPGSPAKQRTIYIAGNKAIQRRRAGSWRSLPGPVQNGILRDYSGGYDSGTRKYMIYAIAEYKENGSGKLLTTPYLTADGGEHWTSLDTGFMRFAKAGATNLQYRTLAASSQHANVLYLSYGNLQLPNDTICNGVARTRDFGNTWELVWQDKGNQPASNISRDWLNERFGPGWGEHPLCLGVSPTHPDICMGTDFGRSLLTLNGGKSWQQVYSEPTTGGWRTRGLEVTTNYDIVVDPFNRQHQFILYTDVGLFESFDGGIGWQSATHARGIPDEWVNTCYALVFDPLVPGRAWAVMSGVHDLPRPKMFRKNGVKDFNGGILYTENSGKAWMVVSKAIGEAAFTNLLLDSLSAVDARVLYATAFGKGVYKSVDGGKTWELKNKGLEGAEPFAWKLSQRKSDGTIFLIVSRRSEDGSIGTEKDGAIYISGDGAENWTKLDLPEGTNGPTSILAPDDLAGRLVLTAWGRPAPGPVAPDLGGGIFVSADDGKTWKQTLTTDQHVYEITYDPRVKRYYACGFNGFAYYSEDGAQNWIRIKGYSFKWGKTVLPDPDNPENIYILTFGGGVWHGPAKGDPNAGDDISTPIHNLKR